MSLRQGQMTMIDLAYSDAPPPQEYGDHARNSASGRWAPSFRFLQEFTKLSTYLGRACALSEEYSQLIVFRCPHIISNRTVKSRRWRAARIGYRDHLMAFLTAFVLAVLNDVGHYRSQRLDEHILRRPRCEPHGQNRGKTGC